MSRHYEVSLADTVLLDIASAFVEAVCKETKKMVQLSCAAYNEFLKPRQYSSALLSVSSGTIQTQNSGSSTVNKQILKTKPSNIEIAQFIELKAQQLGYQSQGIKLLPEKTGEIIEFTFEKPREKEKVLQGGGS